MYLLGLDIGTTGTKASLFTVEGNLISQSYQQYHTISPAEGWFELDPGNIWQAVKFVIKEVMADKHADKVCIAVSSFGEAAVLMDKEDKILGNMILCMDKRGTEEAEILKEKFSESVIVQRTGLPVSSMYTICKLMWIKKNTPEVYDKIDKILLPEDFVNYMLTGQRVIDYSLAARTMCFSVTDKVWDKDILNEAGFEAEMFSTPMPSGATVGKVLPKLSEELGLPCASVVAVGAHDQSCAALGGGILEPGSALIGMGTVECISAPLSNQVFGPEMYSANLNCGIHADASKYLTLAFTFSGGSLVKWFKNTLAVHYNDLSVKEGISPYRMLDMKASKTPTGIYVLPHFSGSGTPYMDESSVGAIVGMTLNTSLDMLYRAVLEGVSYEMRLNADCLSKAGINISLYRAAGGGSVSDLWLQIKSDILGKPIERVEVSEAGTLGTAILAGISGGVFSNPTQGVNALVKCGKVFEPDTDNSNIYNEYFEHYKELYPAVKKII